MSDVYLSSDAATHIPGCDTNCFGAETCMGSAEPMPGRWVPWCVEHDERGIASSWCATGIKKNRTGNTTTNEHDPCVWHPQGAFIPDDEGDTT